MPHNYQIEGNAKFPQQNTRLFHIQPDAINQVSRKKRHSAPLIMTSPLRGARVGARAPAEEETAGGLGSAARGPAPRAASLEPRAAMPPPGEGDQGARAMGRRPQPLLGRGESKARGSRSAPWLRETSGRGGPQPPGPQRQPGAAGEPGGRRTGTAQARDGLGGAPAGDGAGAGPLGSAGPPGPGRAGDAEKMDRPASAH